jgi:hypothetical protein
MANIAPMQHAAAKPTTIHAAADVSRLESSTLCSTTNVSTAIVLRSISREVATVGTIDWLSGVVIETICGVVVVMVGRLSRVVVTTIGECVDGPIDWRSVVVVGAIIGCVVATTGVSGRSVVLEVDVGQSSNVVSDTQRSHT